MDDATTLEYLRVPLPAIVTPADEWEMPSVQPRYLVPGVGGTQGSASQQYRIAVPSSPFEKYFAQLKLLRNERARAEDSEAESPSETSINWAAEILAVLEQERLTPAKVMRSVEGGVAICFMSDDKYSDIECLNTGEILGVVSNRHDRPTVWELGHSVDSIAQAAIRIRKFLQ